jgi:hypothetical protein
VKDNARGSEEDQPMPSGNRPPGGTETPVPTSTLLSISTSLASLDAGVKSIKEDLLPPLSADTKEARDKAREALQKVDNHIGEPDLHEDHGCLEIERQRTQDEGLAEAKGGLLETNAKVASTSKVLWWALGIVAVVLGSAATFAVTSSSAATRAAAELDDLDNIPETVARHDVQIKALEKAQAEDRRTFIDEVRKLPTTTAAKVQSTSPSDEVVEDAADDLPLRPSERRQLLELLERARAREERAAGGTGG